MTGYEYAKKWNEEYKQYNKVFSRYGINIVSMSDMQVAIDNGEYRITVKQSKYHRTASGNWQKKPFETTTRVCGVENYMNVITSIPMFKDRVKREYTRFGYIPTRLSCVSWGTGDTKSVREFYFESLK